MTSYHAGISAETNTSTTVLIGARFFLSLIVGFALLNSSRLFFRSHGWGHRLAGAAHLFWLFLGAWTVHHSTTSSFPTTTTATTPRLFFFGYDFILGTLGILATLTAARDFPHKLVSNASGQSGTLNQTAIVTQDEMIEHSFYQLLNLLQAMYLHTLQYCHDHGPKTNNDKNSLMDGDDGTTRTTISITTRLILLWLVTMPWLFRHMLPVHSFSHNWKVYLKETKTKKNETDDLEVFLYQIKKWQYVFYKHVILHGVNISSALLSNRRSSSNDSIIMIPYSLEWRIFWILLNTSYVMEFFLQSMVKAKLLQQSTMLWLQRFLMMIASLSAVPVVFQYVHLPICLVSLLLNFGHRHHDVLNTMTIAFLALIYYGELKGL